jgi:hypothetical protein
MVIPLDFRPSYRLRAICRQKGWASLVLLILQGVILPNNGRDPPKGTTVKVMTDKNSIGVDRQTTGGRSILSPAHPFITEGAGFN